LKATVTDAESWKKIIDVEIEKEQIENAFEEKIKKYRKEIKLPGFRPGKVTPSIIKARFGDAIRAEVVEEAVQQSFETACADNKIMPITRPKIEELKADADNPISYKAEVEVDPEIDITGLEKLKVKVSPAKVKKADVDNAVSDLRERLAKFEDVERSTKKGDFVSITYEKVTVDGEERNDISSPQYPIEIGASNIKEYDKALVGKNVGDVIDVSVTFPKDYGDEEIAGKSGQFTVKIDKIQEKKLPEIDAEFLKMLGDFESEDALREKIQKDLEDREFQKAKEEASEKAIDSLIKSNPFEVPPARVEMYLNYMAEQVQRYKKPEEPEMSREEIEEKYRETGIKTIKRHRIIDFIAAKEKIKATQAEVDDRIRGIAAQYGQPFESVKQALRKNGTTNQIRDDIKDEKTIDFILGLEKDKK